MVKGWQNNHCGASSLASRSLKYTPAESRPKGLSSNTLGRKESPVVPGLSLYAGDPSTAIAISAISS